MSHPEMMDGELHLLDETGDVIHVFERGNLSRAAYKHMCAWVITNFESWVRGTQLGEAPKLSADELWTEAEKAWDALTPEHQMTIWAMTIQEEQNAKDISQGLLATLNGYQCLSTVKAAFSDAIKRIRDQFISQ
jgi:hypothetical protein